MAFYDIDGYVYTDEFDPNFPGYKKKGKYALLHQYIYWKNTGKVSEKGKTVIHHIDRNKNNNDFSNLELLTLSEHAKIHDKLKVTKEYRLKCTIGKRNFGFRGASYSKRNINPWNKVWKFNGIKIKTKKFLPKGFCNHHDPLSCQIIYDLIVNEIHK